MCMNINSILRRFFLLVAVMGQVAFAGDQKVRVLVLSGSNNHNWKQTTPVMLMIHQIIWLPILPLASIQSRRQPQIGSSTRSTLIPMHRVETPTVTVR